MSKESKIHIYNGENALKIQLQALTNFLFSHIPFPSLLFVLDVKFCACRDCLRVDVICQDTEYDYVL
jgi:hypothetical protein